MKISTIQDTINKSLTGTGEDFILHSSGLDLGEILMYQNNRSEKNRNNLMLALSNIIEDESINYKLIHIINNILKRIHKFKHETHTGKVAINSLMINKLLEWITIPYIKHQLRAANPGYTFSIDQSTLSKDVFQGFDYIIKAKSCSGVISIIKTDLKVRKDGIRESENEQTLNQNSKVRKIYLHAETMNDILDYFITGVKKSHISELRSFLYDFQENFIEKHYHNLRQEHGVHQGIIQEQYNSINREGYATTPKIYQTRKDWFKKPSPQPPSPMQTTDLHASD